MILFNITPNRADGHAPTESLILRTSRWWSCAVEQLDAYGDFALAVKNNHVVGTYRILGYRSDPDQGSKKILDLIELPTTHPVRAWIRNPSPQPWLPGQRQPFKYLSMAGTYPLPDRWMTAYAIADQAAGESFPITGSPAVDLPGMASRAVPETTGHVYLTDENGLTLQIEPLTDLTDTAADAAITTAGWTRSTPWLTSTGGRRVAYCQQSRPDIPAPAVFGNN